MKILTFGTGRIVVTILVGSLAFWTVAPFVPSSALVYVFVNSLILCVSLGIMVTYWPAVLAICRKPSETVNGGDILVIGIFTAWFGAALRTFWSDAFQLLGHPPWMAASILGAFIGWILFIAGVLHQAAKGAVNGHIPNAAWRRIGIIVACATALAIVLIWFFAAQLMN
jgi:hypothetical protein